MSTHLRPAPRHAARITSIAAAAVTASALIATVVPAVAQAAPRPKLSACRPIEVKTFHGKVMGENCRLAEVRHGSVPCVTVESMRAARCRFTAASGHWLEGVDGRMYAVAGQRISRLGARGGDYVVASPAGDAPCVKRSKPFARLSDAAGTASGQELAGVCAYEVALSPNNASGMKLRNYATREVCSTTHGSPDQVNAVFTRSPAPGVYCYTGEGAGLNDINGAERDKSNRYLTGPGTCHVILVGGYEVFAAKRPATRSWPAPGSVDWNTPIVWRPVSSVAVAN